MSQEPIAKKQKLPVESSEELSSFSRISESNSNPTLNIVDSLNSNHGSLSHHHRSSSGSNLSSLRGEAAAAAAALSSSQLREIRGGGYSALLEYTDRAATAAATAAALSSSSSYAHHLHPDAPRHLDRQSLAAMAAHGGSYPLFTSRSSGSTHSHSHSHGWLPNAHLSSSFTREQLASYVENAENPVFSYATAGAAGDTHSRTVSRHTSLLPSLAAAASLRPNYDSMFVRMSAHGHGGHHRHSSLPPHHNHTHLNIDAATVAAVERHEQQQRTLSSHAHGHGHGHPYLVYRNPLNGHAAHVANANPAEPSSHTQHPHGHPHGNYPEISSTTLSRAAAWGQQHGGVGGGGGGGVGGARNNGSHKDQD